VIMCALIFKGFIMKKALGYIRVSTEKQVQDGVSMDNQIQRIKEYSNYNDFSLTEIIEDAGLSGGSNKTRTGFMSLLQIIESKEIEILIIYSLERLSRDMLTLLVFEKLLNEYNIELHTIEGQFDTGTPDGFMNYAMKAFLGEMERRQVKHRTKQAMQFKKEQNNLVGAVPFGYDAIDTGEINKNAKPLYDLVENKEEQETIKTINSMYQKNYSLSKICRELTKKNKRSRNGAEFQPMQVKRVIKNYRTRYSHKTTKTGALLKQFIENII